MGSRLIKMPDPRTIFDEPHFQSLEFLAVKALSEGQIATAFKLADRRCRILPLPEPHCFVLRAEALFQMGAKAAAVADLSRALEIAPDDIAANRRMLAWATRPEQRRSAARALVKNENRFEVLRNALRALQQGGQRDFARVTVLADRIEGWAVWQSKAPLTISIASNSDEISFATEPNAQHPLAEFGNAANFAAKRPTSETPQSISLSAAGAEFYSARAAANNAATKARFDRPPASSTRGQSVTIVVPVYGDYKATKLCIESLLGELNATSHRAILVDDATPDPQIAKYLAGLRTEPRIELLLNTRNLGYTGSINRALAQLQSGDVILLNADTIVPAGFVDRLNAAAYSAANIGTVTPLSNNGEFTSFPIPFIANPTPSTKDIKRIDDIAAQMNVSRIVDIPSGVGFCLYITRDCLDAIGTLSDDFGPGYLEDADFCLRARDRGFRNVCASSVYVGHSGSKSFGSGKRALVVRNLEVLEKRYPKHRIECGVFMAADPLRPARAAIELALAAKESRPTLVVTGTGAVGAVARSRAGALDSKSGPVMILEIQRRDAGATVKLFNPKGGVPQSLEFSLADADDRQNLAELLKAMRPSRIEILDPANVPFEFVGLLMALRVAYDIFIADAGLLGRQGGRLLAAAVDPESADATQDDREWEQRWKAIASGARRILAPCPQAKAFAQGILPGRKIDNAKCSAGKHRLAAPTVAKITAAHLGLVPARSSAEEQWLISEIADRFGKMRPETSITVVGATRDDIDLMRRANVFVTGAVGAEEFETLTRSLNLEFLFIAVTRPLFGHPALSAANFSSLPTAYFDWSKGRVKPRKKDLAIDPSTSLDGVVAALSRWMPAA